MMFDSGNSRRHNHGHIINNPKSSRESSRRPQNVVDCRSSTSRGGKAPATGTTKMLPMAGILVSTAFDVD